MIIAKVNNNEKRHTENHQNERKSVMCHEIGARLLIDDAWHHVADAAAAGLPAILLDRPWNQEPVPPGAIRTHNWPDTVTRVLEHLR
ncbi:hypothetical protein KC906_03240 [Candidatus Kaiserbacteria bacterium]|nr:hypothetical protein [Candidatus Kaiserbacteria bacterium]